MSGKKMTILEKAKQQHFEMLKKNNAISLDIILQIYYEKQEPKIQLELSYLRKKLGLEKNNDYVDRIKSYLLELKLPFELRDFRDVETGKKVSWALTSFLYDVKAYKETQHLVEINISETFIEYMVDRAGYTSIDLSLSKKFKTKYGYKIYEMYRRYYSMPNKVDKYTGFIHKNINELNDKFGTKHKYVSKLLEGINRGLNEIYTLTGEKIFCNYDRLNKKFTFSWFKDVEKIESKCIVPNAKLNEFVDWVIEHSKSKIKNLKTYKSKIKYLILNNMLDDCESLYRGMMIHKYGYTSEEIDKFKKQNGSYKDFSINKK